MAVKHGVGQILSLKIFSCTLVSQLLDMDPVSTFKERLIKYKAE